ncbi:MAG: hemin receptor [Prevotellaceae bacterium]|nr:hemin receptor [Prevotellaceae bacterium]
MKKKIIFGLMAMAAITANAQETYENANLMKPELTGTARYIGMGGAMEALGADISTISTNPAGIGLFRSSSVNLSFGLSSQQDVTTYGSDHKTVPSFDQAGFVYSMRTNSRSFLNFAFNYSKSRNFNQILNAAGKLNGSAQNKLTYNKFVGNDDFIYIDKDGTLLSDYIQFSQLDYLYANNINYDEDEAGNGSFYGYDGDAYDMYRAQSGYIGRYDFNISGNVNNRFYWGVTVGVQDVHYNAYSDYIESLGTSTVEVMDTRKITGTGVDVKAGVIFRPVEESPFRIGLSVSTPTWYKLTTSNYTSMSLLNGNVSQQLFAPEIGESYEFKLYTPWKFGASLGHTVGNNLALGLSYEYADYSTADTRVINGYDYYGNEESYSEYATNQHTKNTLKGVSTIKAGLEFKPDPSLAVRLGFNYVAPMYDKLGVKDGTLDSYGVFYQSQSDFTNWEDTYRITAGLGYNIDKFSIDLAYQYSTTNGNFSPFYDCADNINSESLTNNNFDVCKVSNKRHQLMLTLGYRF